MALSSHEIELVIELKRRGYLDGNLSVVEIGAQQLADGFLGARDKIAEAGRLFGAKTPSPLPPPQECATADRRDLDEGAPYARDFWTWLGFDYAAIDIDGADIIRLDLNYESIAPELVGKYQLVTNFGTTEHVANQLNAFKTIHDLAAPDGVMIHHLPMQGMLNHGLINYNPKFFWMLSRGNLYRTLHISVSVDTDYYELPQNIVDAVVAFDPGFCARSPGYHLADAGLIVVMQKTTDAPYVAPIDLPDLPRADDGAVGRHYAPGFEPVRGPLQFEDMLHRVSGWSLQRELLRRYRRRITHWLG
jgi:hypothetical protein